jgi:hypothetical protein
LIKATGEKEYMTVVKSFTVLAGILAFVVCAYSQTCAAPPAGLISWWPGDGNANDVKGGNHGSLQNGATFGAGMAGQGFSFDGLGSHVAIPHSSTLNVSSFSLIAWVKVPFTASSEYQTIIAKSDNSILLSETRNFGLFVNPFNREFDPAVVHAGFATGPGQFPGPFIAVQGTTPVTNGIFHHVAATFDTTAGVKIFTDGVEETRAAPYPSGLGATPGFTTTPVSIGYNSIVANAYGPMIGIVDEVAIFNRALSASEIQSIYAAGSAGMCKTNYTFVGFLPPVANSPVKNIVRAGRTVPVKWQLRSASGDFISSLASVASISSAGVPCDSSPSSILGDTAETTGGSVLRYDSASDQFVYNWETERSWLGCRVLQLLLSDSSVHLAKFMFD